MAIRSIKVTLGQSLGDGQFSSNARPVADPLTSLAAVDVEIASAVVDVDAALTLVIAADTAVEAADTAVIAADAATAAAVAAAVSTAAVESDVAVLEADGASPTEAHVDDLRITWDALVAAIVAEAALVVTADTAADAAKTLSAAAAVASDAAETSATTADATVNLIDTSQLSADLTDDMIFIYDDVAVDTGNKLKAGVDQVLKIAQSSGLTIPG